MRKAKLTIKYNNSDIPCVKRKNGVNLTFQIRNKNELEILGNKKGLKLLARALLGLAECGRKDGFHIHIDDLYEINDENKSFIILKG